jgi:hypothetical protein
MALYPVNSNGVGGLPASVFPFEVVKELFKEWKQLSPLGSLIGSEATRPIVSHTFKKGDGLQYRVSKLNALLQGKTAKNFEQRRGTAQRQSVNTCLVDCDTLTESVLIENINILQLGSPIELPMYVRSQLVELFAANLNKSIMDALTIDRYPALKTGSTILSNYVAGAFPSFDRVLFPLADGSLIKRSIDNAVDAPDYYWGLNDAGTGVTFPTLVNSMAAVADYETSGLSAKLLMEAKTLCNRGTKSDLIVKYEDLLRPAYLDNKNGWGMNRYIMLIHPETKKSLYSDPLFYQSTFNRGTVIDEDNTPQTINGADYVGRYEGIDIYVCTELNNYEIISADGNKRCAWNLLLGGGAASIGWYEDPVIAVENDPVERSQLYYGHETRGQRLLQFDSKYVAAGCSAVGSADAAQMLTVQNPVIEQGVVHIFTSI